MSHIINQNSDNSNSINTNLSTPEDVANFVSESMANPTLFYEFEEAEVLDVINSKSHPNYNATTNNLGYILIRFLYSSYNKINDVHWTAPYNNLVIVYPLLNEIVQVCEAKEPNSYTNNVNFTKYYWKSVFTFDGNINNNLAINYSLNNSKSNVNNNNVELLAKYNDNKQQEFKLGDVNINGRFNQNLQFTYDNNNLEGYTQLSTNGNKLIQTTNIQELSVHSDLGNSNYEPTDFSEKGLITAIQSDNVVLDTTEKILLSSDNEINISSNNNVSLQSKNNTTIIGKQINIGKNANQSLVLGDKLIDLLTDLISEISKINVVCPSGGGPSSTPVNTVQLNVYKLKLKQVISRYHKVK